MITVHHLNSSRSTRILWVLEELGVQYELAQYQRGANLRAPEDLKKIHPLGKSPVITDSEAGVTLAESGAILEHLLDRFDNNYLLRPQALGAERAQYNYWLHYAEGSLMPQLFLALIFSMIPKQPMPFFVKAIARKIASAVEEKTFGPELKNHFRFIEEHLKKNPFLAGDKFTAADIQMSYPLEVAQDRSEAMSDRKVISDYLQKIRLRPAYQRAIEQGGKVTL